MIFSIPSKEMPYRKTWKVYLPFFFFFKGRQKVIESVLGSEGV